MNLTRIILLFVCILGCAPSPKTYKIKMEIYYNAFDSMLEDNILIRRALIRFPSSVFVKKTVGDSIVLSFSGKNNELIFNKLIGDTDSHDKEFKLHGSIIGYSIKDSVAFVTFGFSPISVAKEQYDLLKKEKNITKIIDAYFHAQNGKLIFEYCKFIGTVDREPVVFK